ncbi:hypothetical protein LB577_31350 [Mesorhizobium sp. B283B1A]|uniref:hypothetical protein n=1 Tax=Mesorhizobium TaxID=68287 RepID=UPI001CD0F5FA|nr:MULTISPECIES: hypothetical protein [Mesorhizobium]MCA0051406.1 hypothetical protein [Mesorhizobium sp. B283B1A]UQS62745.1 hypothetical protein M5D98_21620 [Mesorhizobium opportunistum]
MTVSKLAVALSAMLLVSSLPVWAAEAPQNFAVLDTPAAVPEISFADAAGQPKTLADFGF